MIFTNLVTGLRKLDYGFKNLNTETIFAITDPKNEHSKKVLTKLGFDFQETFDYDGDPTDWFELKKSTWENKSRTANYVVR